MNASSGIVTFLFTDIEGSTRRWEADADAMRIALAAHDEVLRGAITDCGGSLFKHTGDGVCAAFSTPKSAVDAAIAAQRELELPVRMGIATGEAEARGDDYFGAVLNRAARVMSACHGGQVLIAAPRTDLASSVDLIDRGTHRLRDIAKPVPLFQVRAPGPRETFPPLKTADPVLGNLRRPPGVLVGREQDVLEVNSALTTHRLVTLTGVGGVGKTRMALEAGAAADRTRASTRFTSTTVLSSAAPAKSRLPLGGRSSAAASTTCSQLSNTSRRVRPSSAAAMLSVRPIPGCWVMPSTADTPPQCRTAANSMSHTQSEAPAIPIWNASPGSPTAGPTAKWIP